MTRFADDLETKPKRTILKIGLYSVVGIVGITLTGLFIGSVTNPFVQASRIVSKTIDADNVILNYEWFKQQYQDIKAADALLIMTQDAKISFEESAGKRDTWKFEDRQEWARLNSIVLGIKGNRAFMVAEYNAKTQMANRNLFRTSDLPAVIE